MKDTFKEYPFAEGERKLKKASVIATTGCVFTDYIGKDIGYGTIGVETAHEQIPDLEIIDKAIADALKKGDFTMPLEKSDIEIFHEEGVTYDVVMDNFDKGLKNFGQNCEYKITQDKDGYVSIFVSGGSGRFGLRVSKFYNELAKQTNEGWYSYKNETCHHAYLPVGSNEGSAFIREMEFCVDYAEECRQFIANVIINVLDEMYSKSSLLVIESHSNYITKEGNFWIHRNQAVKLGLNEIGVVDNQFVFGNKCHENFNSSSLKHIEEGVVSLMEDIS